MKATLNEISTILGLSERRVRQLEADHVISPPRAGKYDVAATTRSYITFIKSGRDKPSLLSAKIAKLETSRELDELTLSERRRELVPVDELVPVLGKFLSEAKVKIESHSKLERAEKDSLIETLGRCLDAAFGVSTMAVDSEPTNGSGTPAGSLGA